jgi:IclR family transcriptional regulator, acetate operon repressor
MSPKANNPIQSDLTLLNILEGVEAMDGARVTELAKRVNTTKSTAHNHLSTLRERGYVVKHGSEYFLSYRFLELGEETRYRTPLYEFARPVMDDLARDVDKLANLCVEENGKAVYLYRTKSSSDLRFSTKAGDVSHLHCVGIGKAILARMKKERVAEILDQHGLPARTDNTITDREDLFAELDEIRERGVAFDDEEYGDGLRCVAAPITGSDGEVLGAMSVSGPSTHLQGDYYQKQLPDEIRRAANIVELNIKQY